MMTVVVVILLAWFGLSLLTVAVFNAWKLVVARSSVARSSVARSSVARSSAASADRRPVVPSAGTSARPSPAAFAHVPSCGRFAPIGIVVTQPERILTSPANVSVTTT